MKEEYSILILFHVIRLVFPYHLSTFQSVLLYEEIKKRDYVAKYGFFPFPVNLVSNGVPNRNFLILIFSFSDDANFPNYITLSVTFNPSLKPSLKAFTLFSPLRVVRKLSSFIILNIPKP